MSDHSHQAHYVKIWAILIVLFIISVLGPLIEIKIITMITAFGIAFVKAYLVCKHFMHLNVQRPIVLYILVTAVVFMGLFFAGVAADVMRHEGSNWENVAAKEAVERGLASAGSGHHGDDHGHHDDAHGDHSSGDGSHDGHH